MHTLDEWFRLHHDLRHQQWRLRLLAGELPVLVRVDDRLLFFHAGQRSAAPILDETYHGYKALCHIPVALFLWIDELAQPLDADTRERLAKLCTELLARLHETEESEDPHAASIRALLSACVELVDETLAGARDVLPRFESQVRTPMAELMRAAVVHELTRLDRMVRAWTSTLTDAEWARLHVVVCANHQARYRQSTKQYFQRLLGEHEGPGARDERRIIYAEAAESEAEALDLLATHLLDREIGAYFLGSPLAMQQDLLGDAAGAVLDSLFSGSDDS